MQVSSEAMNDEGANARNVSFETLYTAWPIYAINSIDNTELPWRAR